MGGCADRRPAARSSTVMLIVGAFGACKWQTRGKGRDRVAIDGQLPGASAWSQYINDPAVPDRKPTPRVVRPPALRATSCDRDDGLV